MTDVSLSNTIFAKPASSMSTAESVAMISLSLSSRSSAIKERTILCHGRIVSIIYHCLVGASGLRRGIDQHVGSPHSEEIVVKIMAGRSFGEESGEI